MRILLPLLLSFIFWSGIFYSEPTCKAAEASREGLLLEYHFNDDVADSSGRNHKGTVHGNPQFVAGKSGKCLQFDGDGDFVDCGTTLPELRDTFTVECWVKPEATQHTHADIFGNHMGSGEGLVLQQEETQTNRFAAHIGTGPAAWISSQAAKLVPGVWQHVAMVKTPQDLRLYVNGIPVSIVPNTRPMVPSALTMRVGLGCDQNVRHFRGQIDEFRIWNKSLTSFGLPFSASEQAEVFARSLSLQANWSSTPKPHLTVTLDKALSPLVPKEIEQIKVSLDANTFIHGKDIHLPEIVLTRESGFRGELSLAAKPTCCYFTITHKPYVLLGDRRVEGIPGKIAVEINRDSLVPKPVPLTAGETTRPAVGRPTKVLSLDGDQWSIAIDPKNVGREQQWYKAPVADAKPTKVPWVIQDIFPSYHGVAWYWRDFRSPANPHAQGRYLLRFHAVDYLADVWINGTHVGTHAGGETPFVLDVSEALKPGQNNRVAVRVLNPTYEPVDGITLNQTPHGCKRYPLAPGGVYNIGGIVDSVELLVSPAIRVADMFVQPDPKTGMVRIQAELHNASTAATPVFVEFAVAPAAVGETVDTKLVKYNIPPGDTMVDAAMQVQQPHLWDLDDPFLYRVTARVWQEGSASFDERSTRCGFRDFSFENNYFRLNGRRIFLRGPLNLMLYPVGYTVPSNLDWLRRDILAMKMMGFNICRLVFGGTSPRQLDVFDELGMMVYQENYGTWLTEESPQLEINFNTALSEIICRDRNHPSIVNWGILNETHDGHLFRHAVGILPLVRSLDKTRMVMLSSGRWDADWTIGSLSNPGSSVWESPLRDEHRYPNVPYTSDTILDLRIFGTKEHPVLLSENGTGCANNLPRLTRHYEQLGAEYADDARFYRSHLDAFMADWKRWKLSDCWARPEDFFNESERNMAMLRVIGDNALRANPNLAGRFMCAITDSDFDGCGLLNTFRELKPGSMDAMCDTQSPLRWCMFVEPVQVYRGQSVHLEAVLSNEDVLKPGKYPVRLQVVGPQGKQIFDEVIEANIPDPTSKPEPPFALPVFTKDVPIDGPSGKYRFLATFQKGAAATGGDVTFHVADPADMPAVDTEVVLWGDDLELATWLKKHNIPVRPFCNDAPNQREVILVGSKPPAQDTAGSFRQLALRIARGSTAVFITPEVFAKEKQPTAWVPLRSKGSVGQLDVCGGYYRADSFAKRHAIFDGLPAGGIMDYRFYREILPQAVWFGLDEPAEVVAGSIRATFGYGSALLVSVHRLGAGQFILNTLKIRQNLGKDPVAERLLRNILRLAAKDANKPLEPLPADFDTYLKAIGYR
ncbi:MAG: hypothetical protein JXM70_31145 [Pirellulales bacterium]|nr:hypothetical protein [Pirellulales bacterium]